MSWIEILLFLISLIYVIVIIITRKSLSYIASLGSLGGLGLLISYLIFDVPIWQLYPLYFLIILNGVLTLIAIWLKKKGREPYGHRRKIIITSIILILVSGFLMMIFPVQELPKPEGEFAVGTVTFELTDPKRLEQYGEESIISDALRRIKVQAWYPSDDVSGYEQDLWLQDGILLSRSLAKEMKLPFFALDHTKNILSNSYIGASVSHSKESYPVVILSHGWTGFSSLHNDFAELLASNGFIVLGINHTYGAQMTVFDDGFAAELDRNALPDRNETPDFPKYATQLVQTYAGDVELVIDTLESVNEGQYAKVLSGTLDLSKIGLMGHSTGGGADVSVALRDDRVKALFGMDAWVEPLGSEYLRPGLSIPAIFLRSEQWIGGINDEYLIPLVKSSPSARLFQIDGTTHIDFSMSGLFSSLTGIMGFTGDLGRELTARIQHDFILEFFMNSLVEDEISSGSSKENDYIDPYAKLVERYQEVWEAVSQ